MGDDTRSRREIERDEYAAWRARQDPRTLTKAYRAKRSLKGYLIAVGTIVAVLGTFSLIMNLLYG